MSRSRNLGMQRLRLSCPDCGNPLPTYVGRYPQHCKWCRQPYKPMDVPAPPVPAAAPTLESLIEEILDEAVRYWLDPNGREYQIPGPEHAEWIWKHDSSLRREYAEYDSDLNPQIIASSLSDGWVRVSAPWIQIQQWTGKTRRIVNEFVFDHQELFKDTGVNMERGDGQQTTIPWDVYKEDDFKLPEILRWIKLRHGP